MGTWGPGPYDNDAAGDRHGEPAELAPAGQSAAAALARALPTGASLTLVDSPAGRPVDGIEANEDLCTLAVCALDRMMAGDSELPSLWEGDEAFTATVAQVRVALSVTPA